MVTWTKQVVVGYGENGGAITYGEGSCLSTDVKPTSGIGNGSTLLEMNTSKVFAFNQDAGAWVQL